MGGTGSGSACSRARSDVLVHGEAGVLAALGARARRQGQREDFEHQEHDEGAGEEGREPLFVTFRAEIDYLNVRERPVVDPPGEG